MKVSSAHSLGGQRLHVPTGQLWNRSAGTDFWLVGGAAHAGIAGNDLITDFGWTETSILSTQGVNTDLLSSADVAIPNTIGTDALSDLLISPTIFGDYGHGLQAGSILGYTPTKLCLEAYARFSVHSANETVSGFGFSTGTGLTATNHTAFIFSNSTNFAIRSTDGTGAKTDAGAAVDTNFHLWKVVLYGAAADIGYWYLDGTEQGSFTVVTDLFPTAFSMSASTTNRPHIAWVHIWYE